MASNTPNGTYSDVENTSKTCPSSPTPPPVPTKTRTTMVKQTSPAVVRKQLHYHDPTPGGPASLLRTTTWRKIPQPVPRSSQHHRLSRELVGSLKPVNTSESMTHDAPVVSERPKPQSASAVPSRMVQKKKKEMFLSDSMHLPDFVQRYSKSFPVHIKVLKGHCGPSSRFTISTSDTYNIHFMKHTKVIVIKDAHNTPYSIPLNSAIEFGLVYDPNDNHIEAINGLAFEKISEITTAHTPPKVFCALKTFRGEDEKSSVYNNEVLIVKQVLKPRFKGKGALKVYSLLTNSDKLLHEDCIGQFTTQPYMVRMHLLEMIEHVAHPFPHQAIMYLSPDIYQNPEAAVQVQELSNTILSKVITVCHCITETSLIASSLHPYHNSDSDSDIDNLFDIPVDENLAKIEVAVIETNDVEETEKLYDNTRSIVERFNPSKVRSCEDTGSKHTFTAQSLFYSAVRPRYENIGIEIDTPSIIYDKIKPRPFPSKAPPQRQHQQKLQEEIQQQHEKILKQSMQQHMPQQHMPLQRVPQEHMPQQAYQSQATAASKDENYCTVDDTAEFCDDDYDDVETTIKTHKQNIAEETAMAAKFSMFQSDTTELKARIVSLESETKKQTQELQTVKVSVDQHSKQFKAFEAKCEQLAASQLVSQSLQLPRQIDMNREGGERSSSSQEANREILRSVNSMQVQNLLEAMDLTHYKEKFSKEDITGEILAELDEDILQHELGVSSKIHRIRLMKIINGQHSVQHILSGTDPYVSFGSH